MSYTHIVYSVSPQLVLRIIFKLVIYAQSPLNTFSQLATDFLATRIVRRIANKPVTSWQQVCCVSLKWSLKNETTRHHRHNGLLPAPICYGLVTDLLQGSYGETGIMDFGLFSANDDEARRQVMAVEQSLFETPHNLTTAAQELSLVCLNRSWKVDLDACGNGIVQHFVCLHLMWLMLLFFFCFYFFIVFCVAVVLWAHA